MISWYQRPANAEGITLHLQEAGLQEVVEAREIAFCHHYLMWLYCYGGSCYLIVEMFPDEGGSTLGTFHIGVDIYPTSSQMAVINALLAL